MSRAVRLDALHLQLTGRCDLRCRMCGQWGENGYRNGNAGGSELGLADWLAVLDAVAADRPRLTLWGGEPLLSPACIPVARRARELGMEVLLVTNGTRLGALAGALAGLCSWIYVSLDGPADVHDRIRGRAGTFARVAQGIARIRAGWPGQRLCAMTTLVAENRGRLGELADRISAWGVRDWILSPQMFLSRERAGAYGAFMDGLGCARTDAASWTADFPAGHGAAWRDEVDRLIAGHPGMDIRLGAEGLAVTDLAAWFDRPDADLAPGPCWAPFRRLAIRSDGSTSACLDISDGSLGDIRADGVGGCFRGAAADRFRGAIAALANPACARCVWRWHGEDYRRTGP